MSTYLVIVFLVNKFKMFDILFLFKQTEFAYLYIITYLSIQSYSYITARC